MTGRVTRSILSERQYAVALCSGRSHRGYTGSLRRSPLSPQYLHTNTSTSENPSIRFTLPQCGHVASVDSISITARCTSAVGNVRPHSLHTNWLSSPTISTRQPQQSTPSPAARSSPGASWRARRNGEPGVHAFPSWYSRTARASALPAKVATARRSILAGRHVGSAPGRRAARRVTLWLAPKFAAVRDTPSRVLRPAKSSGLAGDGRSLSPLDHRRAPRSERAGTATRGMRRFPAAAFAGRERDAPSRVLPTSGRGGRLPAPVATSRVPIRPGRHVGRAPGRRLAARDSFATRNSSSARATRPPGSRLTDAAIWPRDGRHPAAPSRVLAAGRRDGPPRLNRRRAPRGVRVGTAACVVRRFPAAGIFAAVG